MSLVVGRTGQLDADEPPEDAAGHSQHEQLRQWQLQPGPAVDPIRKQPMQSLHADTPTDTHTDAATHQQG